MGLQAHEYKHENQSGFSAGHLIVFARRKTDRFAITRISESRYGIKPAGSFRLIAGKVVISDEEIISHGTSFRKVRPIKPSNSTGFRSGDIFHAP